MLQTIKKTIGIAALVLTFATVGTAQNTNRQFQVSRVAPSVQSQNWEVSQLVSAAAKYLDQYWSAAFARGGNRNYRAPMVYRSSQRINNAYYKAADHAIYYDYYFFSEQMRKHGDFAVVTIMAHEWGHAMQNILKPRFALTISKELQADCYAGAFARNESFTTRLESNDIPKAISSLIEAGDHSSTSIDDRQAHGSWQKRTLAFRRGFSNGLRGCGDVDIANVALFTK